MSKDATAGNTVCNFQFDQIDGFNSLVELALDLRWSWSHATDE
jgi:starch phosphorylase